MTFRYGLRERAFTYELQERAFTDGLQERTFTYGPQLKVRSHSGLKKDVQIWAPRKAFRYELQERRSDISPKNQFIHGPSRCQRTHEPPVMRTIAVTITPNMTSPPGFTQTHRVYILRALHITSA